LQSNFCHAYSPELNAILLLTLHTHNSFATCTHELLADAVTG
jgi:hypothetical protein